MPISDLVNNPNFNVDTLRNNPWGYIQDMLSGKYTTSEDEDMFSIMGNMVDDMAGESSGDSANDISDTQLFSMSQYLNDNPDATWLDAWKEAAKYSDEWAEKLMDYYAEKQSLDEANAYTASREDTAYQRLVEDLKKAGLNPAMMFGSSASPSASASQGYIRQTEGANARSIGNYSKLQQLLISYALYQLKKDLGTANTANNFLKTLTGFIGNFIPTTILKGKA